MAEGRAEGFIEGLTEGLSKGLTKGRTEGRTEEAARALLTVLRVRGLAVSATARERILAHKDLERLGLWLEKAAVGSAADLVFDHELI